MNWASFQVVEGMAMVHCDLMLYEFTFEPAQPQLKYKRSAYIAAKHIFTKESEVVLLCTQQLAKVLSFGFVDDS